MTRHSTRRLESEEELYAAAVSALARRGHSVHEMRQLLERRAADRGLIPLVLARLKDRGMLDDSRYARQFARNRSANRRQGPYRIARELRARGVPERWIEAALEELADDSDQRTNLRRRIESWLRRHGGASVGALDRKRTAALYGSLLRAGFSSEQIRGELRRLGRVAENLPEEAENPE